MKLLNAVYFMFAAALIASPFTASAKITCESMEAMIDVPDDQCSAISDSARRCFTALNQELVRVEKTKDKESRARASSELKSDYVREIKNWRMHFTYVTQIGEGRACIDQSAEVDVWIDEMEKDLKSLEKRRY